MKELYLGALDLSPYLESITNGYILNLRGVPPALKKEMELCVYEGVMLFCNFGYFKRLGYVGLINNKKPDYWLFVGKVGDKMAFQFLKTGL